MSKVDFRWLAMSELHNCLIAEDDSLELKTLTNEGVVLIADSNATIFSLLFAIFSLLFFEFYPYFYEILLARYAFKFYKKDMPLRILIT